MVWELTLQAWALAGRALPQDSRGSLPVRRISLDSEGSEDPF